MPFVSSPMEGSFVEVHVLCDDIVLGSRKQLKNFVTEHPASRSAWTGVVGVLLSFIGVGIGGGC
jgi:hypothetical protein